MNKKYILLRNVPEDIFDLLLDEQSRIKKAKKISQYSLENTIYGLLRTRCKDTIKKTPA